MGPLPLAVHISDGVLATPWLVAGFAGMVLLLIPACYRVRDEEIPRIALMTAAFFAASLIHIRVGPTSVHLLLNGLVGVILGRRAGLAIPVGLALQAVLLGHGGISALGVNACVMTLPALAAAGAFGVLRRIDDRRVRAGLVFCSALAWVICLVFVLALLFSNSLTGVTKLDPHAALQITLHPAILLPAVALALAVLWWERREAATPGFSRGLTLGVFAVLATAILNAAVLLWGGAEDWHSLVLLVLVAHLPIAAIEGIVLGFTVSFLARVKPELVGGTTLSERWCDRSDAAVIAVPARGVASEPTAVQGLKLPGILVLAGLSGLALSGSASGHRLEAEYRFLPDGRVQVESWFDLTGDSPPGATVQVLRPGGQLFIEGRLDDKGLFTFACPRTEPLRVVVSAGAGHRKELLIPIGADTPSPVSPAAPIAESINPQVEGTFANRTSRVSSKDVVTGIGFLLALAAFVLSIRNARALREMRGER